MLLLLFRALKAVPNATQQPVNSATPASTSAATEVSIGPGIEALEPRLKASQAYEDRKNNSISLLRRLREYGELGSFLDHSARRPQLQTRTQIACTDPAHGPVNTTNLDYWKIRNVNDWQEWMVAELEWSYDNRREIFDGGVLDIMAAEGWAHSAQAIRENLIQLSRMRGTH